MSLPIFRSAGSPVEALGVSNLSASYTLTSGDALLVDVSYGKSSAPNPPLSVTANGVAMTRVAVGSQSSYRNVARYLLLGAAAGSQAIVVTMDSVMSHIGVRGLGYQNVTGSAGSSGAGNYSSSGSISENGASGNLLAAALLSGQGVTLTLSSGTLRTPDATPNIAWNLGDIPAGSGATIAGSYGVVIPWDWAAVELIGTGGGGTTRDIAPTDPALVWSPYTTQLTGTFARWTTEYSSLRTSVTVGANGLVSLLLDTTSLNGCTPNLCPLLAISIDNAPFTTALLAYSAAPVVLALGTLPAGTHVVEVYLRSVGLGSAVAADNDRWTPKMAVTITGVRVASDASVSAPSIRPKRLLAFGDSNMCGADMLGTTLVSTDNDGTQAVPALLGAALNAEVGAVAYGGAGWLRGIANQPPSMSYPGFYNADPSQRFMDALVAGVPRVFSPAPDYVVVEFGANDPSLAPADVTNALALLRSLVGTAWIFIITPFAGQYASTIAAGITALGDARVRQLTSTLPLIVPGTPSRDSNDAVIWSQHLNVRGAADRSADLAHQIGAIAG